MNLRSGQKRLASCTQFPPTDLGTTSRVGPTAAPAADAPAAVPVQGEAGRIGVQAYDRLIGVDHTADSVEQIGPDFCHVAGAM